MQALNLHSTKITDAALPHLTGMINLRSLILANTKVTDAVQKLFKEKLQDLKIQR